MAIKDKLRIVFCAPRASLSNALWTFVFAFALCAGAQAGKALRMTRGSEGLNASNPVVFQNKVSVVIVGPCKLHLVMTSQSLTDSLLRPQRRYDYVELVFSSTLQERLED